MALVLKELKYAVTARLNTIGDLVSYSRVFFLTIATSFISFLILVSFASTAFADTLVVTSEPVKRGSVTPGAKNIVMQRLVLKTDVGAVRWQAVKLNEFGTSDATINVGVVVVYKETNGLADIQFTGTPDTTVTSGSFNAEETLFTLNPVQTITTTPETYYIVYEVPSTAVTGGNPTIGSRLVDQSYITIDTTGINADDAILEFANLQSREVTIVRQVHARGGVGQPGPFSTTSNLCQTCHSVHMAPDFGPTFGLTGSNRNRRILVQPYFENPEVVNAHPSDTFNALCLTCHDGTGASTNIKAQYNSTNPNIEFEGHETTSTAASTSGYKPPPSGEQYNANVKMPCMICHDVHYSKYGNYALLSDDLYDYAIANNWTESTPNGFIDSGDETCLVCHKYANDTERTSVVMGKDLTMPVTHDPPDAKSSGCVTTCHVDPHELDAGN